MFLKLDPRTKLILLLMIIAVTISSPGEQTEMICIGAIAVLELLCGAFRQCFIFLAIYGATFLLLGLCPFMHPVVSSAVLMVCLVIRKLLPPMMFAMGIVLNTKVSSLMSAMQSMRVPSKITIPVAVGMRYLPAAKQEMACISDAMKLRGLGVSAKNVFTRPQVLFEGAVIPIMLRSATIAEELSAASITRGIDNGDKNRVPIERLRLGVADFAAMAVFAAILILTLTGGIEQLWSN